MGILNIKSGVMYDGPGSPAIRVKTSVSTHRNLFQRLMDSRQEKHTRQNIYLKFRSLGARHL